MNGTSSAARTVPQASDTIAAAMRNAMGMIPPAAIIRDCHERAKERGRLEWRSEKFTAGQGPDRFMTVITDKKAFEKAVPIFATDAKRLPKLLDSLTPVERRWAQASNFDGAPDSFAIVPDARGGIARVLAGVRDGDDPWSLAGLPLKLPRARYALGKGPVAIAPEKAAFAWDLGSYQFTRYRKAKRKPSDLQLEASARVREALDMAQAVRLVRDLVNTPA